ncbi:MAG: cysteine--tRNA ligase [Candidatus Eremiobacteraeota bacterium]|nr:cysteine--tRNA ligase [Candidatus Eremiobacteraeota bacterium]
MLELGHLNLYNSRTRTVEPFQPLRDAEVRIYVCGLTPSAQAHLGHARSFLFFDVLRRYLMHRKYTVTFVQNVTDIDDRSIRAARETGESYRAIIDRHYAEFKASMHKLGVLEYDHEPYATAYIPQIQAMIVELLDAEHAYVSKDGIYYRVASFANYGKLANRNIDELEAGARIEVDEEKEDPLDFALWKFAKPDEPKWPFDPYGDGRPGWHIECSAMARSLLDPQGEGFDIHGGGADLIFPHHENEIAQSEPLMTQPPMANFWVHGGLLLFDNKKMSKSLGNYEPLSDLLERHDPQAIRLSLLQTSYAKVKNFTDESVAGAAVALRQLKKAYRSLHARSELVTTDLTKTGYTARVETALDDDMNTAAALAAMLEFAAGVDAIAARAGAGETLYEFAYLLALLGIAPNDAWLHEPSAALSDDFVAQLATVLNESFDAATPQAAIERVITLRHEARARKDWAASDRLRDALLECGVALKDSKEGTSWSVAAD